MFSKQRNKTEGKMGPYFADKMIEFKRNRVQYSIYSRLGLIRKNMLQLQIFQLLTAVNERQEEQKVHIGNTARDER